MTTTVTLWGTNCETLLCLGYAKWNTAWIARIAWTE